MQSEVQPATAQQTATHVRSGMMRGFKAMGIRFMFSLILRAVSTLTLSRILAQDDYGLFGIVSVIAGLGVYFSDFGMGAALVQQKDEPSTSEATTVFLCQQLFTTSIVLVIIIGMPWILPFYNAPSSARWPLVALALGLWLSSLRAVPAITLERQLKFEALARCDMLESAVQLAASVVLGLLGTGAWALVGGGLFGRLAGLIAIWFASPWRPHGRFDRVIAKRIWQQGLPFQMNAVLPQLVVFPIPMLLSQSFGIGGLGLINWAGNQASVPLMLSGMLNRVAFPAFSRLESHLEELGRIAGESVQRLGMGLSLAFSPVVLSAPVLILFVFGSKWLGAVGLFQWGVLDALVVIMANLLAQVLPAAGYVTQALKLQVPMGLVRVFALWSAIRLAGINGVGPANYTTSLLLLFVYAYLIRRMTVGSNNIVFQSFKPLFTLHLFVGIAQGVAFLVVRDTSTLPKMLVHIVVALVVWAVCVGLYDVLSPDHPIRTEVKSLLRMAKVKRTVPTPSGS